LAVFVSRVRFEKSNKILINQPFYFQKKLLDLPHQAKGSLKNNFTFYTPMHPAWLRCESSEYPDIPAFSRLARQAPQRLKL